jgi:apolipoprotein N-acyltransferase
MNNINNFIFKLIGYMIGFCLINAIVMWIYNSIIPDVFGFKPIGYWQLFGLYVVCHYLFKPLSFKIKKDDLNN